MEEIVNDKYSHSSLIFWRFKRSLCILVYFLPQTLQQPLSYVQSGNFSHATSAGRAVSCLY